jgi:FlaA1/EpsC-like NDP-sugar epimerase
MARWGDRRRRGHETQVLLLGTGNRAQRIAAQIESSPRRALRVIGFLDDDPS